MRLKLFFISSLVGLSGCQLRFSIGAIDAQSFFDSDRVSEITVNGMTPKNSPFSFFINSNGDYIVFRGDLGGFKDGHVFQDSLCTKKIETKNEFTNRTWTFKFKEPIESEGLHTFYLSVRPNETDDFVCLTQPLQVNIQYSILSSRLLVEASHQWKFEDTPKVTLSNFSKGDSLTIFTEADCAGSENAKFTGLEPHPQGFVSAFTRPLSKGEYRISVLHSDAFGNSECLNSDSTHRFVGWAPVVKIVANDYGALALRQDGLVVTWGAPAGPLLTDTLWSEINNGTPIVDIFKNDEEFAVLYQDGSVKSWNGSGLSVPAGKTTQLNGSIPVTNIYSNTVNFAALRRDGSVITWGQADEWGADSSAVASDLNGSIKVKSIVGNLDSFAALREDGSVVVWGLTTGGANTSGITNQINGTIPVVKIYTKTGSGSYAAIRSDGKIVTWGAVTPEVLTPTSGQFNDVYMTDYAFAATTTTGTLRVWGYGQAANTTSIAGKIDGSVPIISVAGSNDAFAAVRADGTVVSWGDPTYSGDSSSVASELNGTIKVKQVFANYTSFAALRENGSIITWNPTDVHGGNSSYLGDKINGTIPVIRIVPSLMAYAAERSDGSWVSWGVGSSIDLFEGGLNGEVPVKDFVVGGNNFYAIRSDNRVVSWGNGLLIRDSDRPWQQELNGTIPVKDIVPSEDNFAFLRQDGSVITLGKPFSESSVTGSNRLRLLDSKPVERIVSTGSPAKGYGLSKNAFTAIHSDGSSIVWGDRSILPDVGASAILSSASFRTQQVVSSFWGFFGAIGLNGSVVNWGNSVGGTPLPSSLADGSEPASSLTSNIYAMAAITRTGAVKSWGSAAHGGSLSGSQINDLNGTIPAKKIAATSEAFAVLRQNGSVIPFGMGTFGGALGFEVRPFLDGTVPVVDLASNMGAFAALRSNGSVVTWGDSTSGGVSTSVSNQINGTVKVVQIYGVSGDENGFVALRENGSVVSWGFSGSACGLASGVAGLDGSRPIKSIFISQNGDLAALTQTGSLLVWGCGQASDASLVADELDGSIPVREAVGNSGAFAALRSDGSVVTWGNSTMGGDSTDVRESLSGIIPVTSLKATSTGFTALRADGSVIVWGNVQKPEQEVTFELNR